MVGSGDTGRDLRTIVFDRLVAVSDHDDAIKSSNGNAASWQLPSLRGSI